MGGAVPPFSAPLPLAICPDPAEAVPGPVCVSRAPPPSHHFPPPGQPRSWRAAAAPHTGGVCVPPQCSPQTPRLPSPQLRAPPRRLGEGLRAGRAQGSPPPGLTVPAPRPPFPSAGRSVHPPRCAQVRSAAGRRLRAGRGLGRASPRPRRRGRAEAARAGGGALATGFWAAGRREWDPLIFHAAQGLSYFFRIKRQTSTSPRGGGSPPALAASSPLGAAPSFGAQQLPLSRRVGSAVGFAALSPPEPPLPSAAAEHSERVSPHFPAPVSWRGWQRVTAEPTFRRAFPPGGGALRASSPNSQGTKPTDGHRGIPQPPALGRYNQQASAATRTRPGTSFLHGGIFFWW